MNRRKLRKGLVIRGQRGNPVARRALIRFARWARREFEFPIRVPVYLSNAQTVRFFNGERVSAKFIWGLSRREEPYISVATGDYPQLRRERGRYNALATTVHSLCHEILHYQQWWAREEMTERGIEVRATTIVKRYLREARR